MTSLPTSDQARKRLGAWYTSENLVRPLVDWAVRTASDRVLDPASGDGAFLIEAARKLQRLRARDVAAQLVGVDISPAAIEATRGALSRVAAGTAAPILICADFFAVHPPLDTEATTSPVNAVVGNPPYIRFQSFTGNTRARAVARCRGLGVKMGGLASSWAPFVVHAASFLRKGGRLAFVLPEEFVHASYAAPVRKFLRANFREIGIISFHQHVFPDTQERVVLLAADGYLCAPTGRLLLLGLNSPGDIVTLKEALSGAELIDADAAAPAKWLPGSTAEHHSILDRAEKSGLFTRLSTIGKAGIGYVSGANDFFVLSKAKAAEHGIPMQYLRPTLTAARHCVGAAVRKRDLQALIEANEPVLLLNCKNSAHAALLKYRSLGEQAGIPMRYKCRVRSPWYDVPGVTVPDAFLTYMSDQGPRLALNSAHATCSNTLLAVNLPAVPRALTRVVAWCFYNSVTQLSAELIGRPYGGGVLKLEPSEADRLLVPSLTLLRMASLESRMLGVVDRWMRTIERADVESKVDEVLLVRHARLGKPAVLELQTALAAARERRLSSTASRQARLARTRDAGLRGIA